MAAVGGAEREDGILFEGGLKRGLKKEKLIAIRRAKGAVEDAEPAKKGEVKTQLRVKNERP